MAYDNEREPSAAFSLIIFLRIVMAVPLEATTKVTWKASSVLRDGTSWYPFPGLRVEMPSTLTWKSNVASDSAMFYAATERVSVRGLPLIMRS